MSASMDSLFEKWKNRFHETRRESFMRPYRLPALNKAEQKRNSRKAFFRPYKTRSPLNPTILTEPPIVAEKRQNPYSWGCEVLSHQPAQKLTINGPPPDAEKNRQTIIWKTSFSPTHHLTRNISDISRTNKVINFIIIKPQIFNLNTE